MPTDPTPRDRAFEVIDAYGGDMRRWPADARPALAALVAGDPDLRAALVAAQRLDAELAEWATAPAHPALPFDPAKLPAQRPMQRWRWVGLGAGVAAAAAAVAASVVMLVSAPAGEAPAPVAIAAVTPGEGVAATAHTSASPTDGFAYVFMPTYDEENLI